MRRPSAVLVAAVLCLLAAGCSKADPPPPVVTVTAGSTGVQARATAWCAGADRTHCRSGRPKVPLLHAAPGSEIGITVAKEVGSRPWVVLTDGKITSPVQSGVTTYQISDKVPAKATFLLQVQTLSTNGKDIQPTGNWVFRVTSR
jgi:hypothetical protein